MRRLSKAKKGKGAASEDSKEPVPDSQEAETQGNGNPAPSDDDEVLDKKGSQNQKKNNKRGRKSATGKVEEAEKENDSDSDVPLKVKKGKRARKGNSSAGEDNEDDDAVKDELQEEGALKQEYEVEKVVDSRMYEGSKQYKVRWKGYSEDEDTWEFEADLNCPQLIKAFLSEHPDSIEKASKASIKSAGGKKHKKAANSSQPRVKKQSAVEPVSEEDGEKVYEVEKVVEVHFKKNGQREFLIRWKGFGPEDDTWEPEPNLNCKELIEKFMEKVNKAKELPARELRANPQATNRFTLLTPDSGRRLSSRHTSKQRTTYYNAE